MFKNKGYNFIKILSHALCLTFTCSLCLPCFAEISKNEIYEIQQKLNLLGHPAGKPDGIAGSKTFKAIKSFSKKHSSSDKLFLNKSLLEKVRKYSLTNPDIVFENLDKDLYAESPLTRLSIPIDYQFFLDNDRLQSFHKAYGKFIRPNSTVNNGAWDLAKYFNDCERAISEFDISWNAVQIQRRFIRCKTAYAHFHFNNPSAGVKVVQRILLRWANLQPVIFQGKSKSDEEVQGYAASMTLASIAQFYAVYYDLFSFTNEQRSKVDTYLKNWLITEDLFPKSGRKSCNPESASEDFQNSLFFFDTDNCGSNRWRMALGAVYLGLRLKDQLLFKAGTRHTAIALAAIDADGIFMPWAKKGAMALSYQRQLPEVLTLLADAFESVGYDFYEHKTFNGKRVHEVYARFFEFIDEPSQLKKYAASFPNFGGIDYFEFIKRPVRLQQIHEQIHKNVLNIHSYDYFLRYREDQPEVTLEDSWVNHWGDYVGVFMMTSGVAVNYAKKQNANKAENNIIALRSNDPRSINKNYKTFLCDVVIERRLHGDNDVLGNGKLQAENGIYSFEEFEWRSEELKSSDKLQDRSNFGIDESGKIIGDLAIHSMIGSDRLDYVPFGKAFSGYKSGFPSGTHSATIYDYTINLKVKNCSINDPIEDEAIRLESLKPFHYVNGRYMLEATSVPINILQNDLERKSLGGSSYKVLGDLKIAVGGNIYFEWTEIFKSDDFSALGWISENDSAPPFNYFSVAKNKAYNECGSFNELPNDLVIFITSSKNEADIVKQLCHLNVYQRELEEIQFDTLKGLFNVANTVINIVAK